ncbi:hypothetical protein A8990_14519 [Paenibacillus taihuensis]|uniref:Uncharacterized protein n=1 Tax=Paenibacillus taihuensis TaxID=1156355 RepID=A0A3D9R2Z7_9BACL|nr:hypothetical protein [Paenibacillus taihuensis]REE67010.1 hypothetical protein A8990_14519 [Paenibacillus taihuensis]
MRKKNNSGRNKTTTKISKPEAWNFQSAPNLHPMKVTINLHKPGTAPGYIFVSPYITTETLSWQVRAGDSPENMNVVASGVPRKGFETVIDVPAEGPYFQVQALDVSSHVIGTSRIIRAYEDDE